MSRPVRPAGRTRTINALLGLILAACVGVIFADQAGYFGGASSTATTGTASQDSGVTSPNLGPAPTEVPSTTAPSSSGSTQDSSTTTTPATPANGTGYGDIK